MSKLEKLKDKAKGLEAKDPKGAIETWQQVLKGQEEEGDPNPDLAVFNRIGDLYLKVREPAQAADYYDQAVDKYAELGFHNNAIAMCNKVLRNAPGRQTTYLKLAKLYAAKGFIAEAKQNFVEYAERMQKIGKIQQAFAALKEFTDISPENTQLRGMLEEHLQMYGDAERRSSSRAAAPAATSHAPEEAPWKSGKRKTSSLVFLDVAAPPGVRGGRAAPPAPAPQRPAPLPEPAPVPEPEVETLAQSLVESVTPEPDSSLEIESTSLADEVEVPGGEGNGGAALLEGFEGTSAEFGQVELDGAGDVPSLRDEVTPEPVQPMAELEPTVPATADETDLDVELEPMLEHEIEIEPTPTPAPPPAPPKRASFPAVTPPPKVAPVVPKRPGVGSPPRGGSPKAPGPTLHPPAPEPPKVKPVVPKRPAPPSPAPAPAPERPKRKAVVEVPPLELEPDFDTASTEAAHAVDEPPLAVEDIPPTGGFIQTEEDTSVSETRRSAFIDLGLDGVVTADAPPSLVFTNIEATPAPPTIDQLEALVADDPDDPEAHRALGEALIEAGDRDRGIEELDHATAGFENLGNLPQAQHLGEEILRLDPNSVRHRQKQVEYAFKSGAKGMLVAAYLELADTLLRQDLPDKARAVYQRVAEHDAKNERAKAALAMLAPAASPPPVAPKPKVKEERTAPKDAKLKVRDEAVEEGDFVDLGAMVLEGEPPARDTRMKVADEEPTGDEEKDFQDMLARFKQGIDENIDEADFESHYDLGVAFKEMGLFDEAIAELQKALRAPEGKLRTSEALGVCFFEKGAYAVAESILRRGLELPAARDEERLGIIYWLARALEGQGKGAEAKERYGRGFAANIRFLDVRRRVQ